VTSLWDGRQSFDPQQAQILFSSPQRPDRLWDTPSLLSKG